MKRYFGILIFLTIMSVAYAQVERFSGNFDEAKAVAMKSGKIILVNCTTPVG